MYIHNPESKYGLPKSGFNSFLDTFKSMPMLGTVLGPGIDIMQHFMNRKYNEPKQQMERLKKAGLNPNLIYKTGIQNTSGGIPQVGNLPLQADRMQFAQAERLQNENRYDFGYTGGTPDNPGQDVMFTRDQVNLATRAAADLSANLSGMKQRNWEQFSRMEWRDIVNKSKYLDDSTRKYFNTTQGIDKLIEAMRKSGGKMSTFESIITAVMLSQMSIPTPNVNYQSGPAGVNYNFGF